MPDWTSLPDRMVFENTLMPKCHKRGDWQGPASQYSLPSGPVFHTTGHPKFVKCFQFCLLRKYAYGVATELQSAQLSPGFVQDYQKDHMLYYTTKGPDLWNILNDSLICLNLPNNVFLVDFADEVTKIITARIPNLAQTCLRQVIIDCCLCWWGPLRMVYDKAIGSVESLTRLMGNVVGPRSSKRKHPCLLSTPFSCTAQKSEQLLWKSRNTVREFLQYSTEPHSECMPL